MGAFRIFSAARQTYEKCEKQIPFGNDNQKAKARTQKSQSKRK